MSLLLCIFRRVKYTSTSTYERYILCYIHTHIRGMLTVPWRLWSVGLIAEPF